MLCSNCMCSISATGNPPVLEAADLLSLKSLTELNAELVLVDKMARYLEERRMLLKHRMNADSPIGRLPAELFIQICQECDVTPLQLGSVCQDWRRIIWSTPLLWSSLSIHVRWRTGTTKCNLLKQWLRRAETTPLRIKVTADNDCDEALYGIFKMLVSRAAFWGSIDCVVPAPAYELLENCTFPLLTSVKLRPASSTLTTFFTEPPKMFDAVPRLVDLDLLGYNTAPEGVMWARLRSLKSQALRVPDLLDILRCSPSLVECQARKIYGTTDEFGDIDYGGTSLGDTLQHTNLTCLDVSLLSVAALPLLDSIALPSLLRLKVKYNGPGSILHRITGLLERSRCRLRALDIEEPNLMLANLIICLKATPSLEDLHIMSSEASVSPASIGGTWGKELVHLMNPRYSDPLLPLLVSFDYYGPLLCDVVDLLDMLQHRRVPKADCLGWTPDNPHTWIRSVNVTSVKTYNMTKDDSDHIRNLTRSEVCLTIRPVLFIASQPPDRQRMRVINNALEH
ncbi:hypothetical protein D9619_008629 [Psilocybe cf. subviscida]|uniref:F-box domain-containing protein n=1 Tax=Psilocybe cf. subviscida TaxID=2480587 RepID=A0A8H5BAY2_9AGAR|nr:hypothetical protein D9619_008629 [Psilocybe cf. subviscida]